MHITGDQPPFLLIHGDKDQSVPLYQSTHLQSVLKAAGKRYLLTMATGTNNSWIEHTEMDKVQASLDFVNLMTYDMAGDWDQALERMAGSYAIEEFPNVIGLSRSFPAYTRMLLARGTWNSLRRPIPGYAGKGCLRFCHRWPRFPHTR